MTPSKYHNNSKRSDFFKTKKKLLTHSFFFQKMNSFKRLSVMLWGDLAKNEGAQLEDELQQQPIIILLNVQATTYEGTH